MKTFLTIAAAFLFLGLNAQNLTLKNDRYFDENDQLFSGTYTETTEDGKAVAQYSIEYGQLHGEATFFTSSGAVEEIGNYAKGNKHGKWERMGENGKVVGEAHYLNGKKNGTWTIWNEAGQKTYHMVYENGERVDVWRMWDDEGTLLSEKTYD